MNVLKIISLVALLCTFIPSLLFFMGSIDHTTLKGIALVGTIVWFIVTPIWIGRSATNQNA